jgi:hypothetical protein
MEEKLSEEKSSESTVIKLYRRLAEIADEKSQLAVDKANLVVENSKLKDKIFQLETTNRMSSTRKI